MLCIGLVVARFGIFPRKKQPIRGTTWTSVQLRHQYGIFRVESQTSLERNWAREERRLFAQAKINIYKSHPVVQKVRVQKAKIDIVLKQSPFSSWLDRHATFLSTLRDEPDNSHATFLSTLRDDPDNCHATFLSTLCNDPDNCCEGGILLKSSVVRVVREQRSVIVCYVAEISPWMEYCHCHFWVPVEFVIELFSLVCLCVCCPISDHVTLL